MTKILGIAKSKMGKKGFWADFELAGADKNPIIAESLWYAISVIGDRPPLSWSGSAFQLKREKGLWRGRIFVQDDELSYRYLAVVLKKDGSIVHIIEGNLPDGDRRLGPGEKRTDFFSGAMVVQESDISARLPCDAPWLSPIISADGAVALCCADEKFTLELGNIRDESLADIWHNHKAWLIRLWHIIGDYHFLPVCNGCIHWKKATISHDMVKKTLEKADHIHPELARYERRIKGIIRKDRFLMIELTDRCNLKCHFCSQVHDDWAKVHGLENKGFMTWELFEKIVKQAEGYSEKKEQPFTSIMLFWLGEPTLHPEFSKLLLYIARRNQEKAFAENIEIHTNGTGLNAQLARDILKASEYSPLTIIISLDAIREKTWQLLKNGGGIGDGKPDLKRESENGDKGKLDLKKEGESGDNGKLDKNEGKYADDCRLDLQKRCENGDSGKLENKRDFLGDFTGTVHNVREFIRMFSARKKSKMRLVLQFIASPANFDEAPDFIEYWRDFVQSLGLGFQATGFYDWSEKVVAFIRYMDSGGNYQLLKGDEFWNRAMDLSNLWDAKPENFIPKGPPYRLGRGRSLCSGPWQFFVIRHDGALVPCCHDTRCLNNLGNVNEISLLEAEESQKMKELRLSHIQGRRKGICADCALGENNVHGADDRDIIEFLLKNNRQDLISAFLDGQN